MDIVITYVDGLDPIWQQQYGDTVGKETLMQKRFRDWGTLKYLLRGIEECIPFVGNVYLLVSGESQVPQWADKSKLKIICHKDIIPEDKLPLFNSASIEMFIHRIQGLNEEYVYLNDDFFPVSSCTKEDFFHKGKSRVAFSRCWLASGQYKKHCRNSDRKAMDACGKKASISFIRPQHICSPMLKSACEELYGKIEKDILDSVSAIREDKNYNQYLYLDYMYHRGFTDSKRISNKHLSMAVSSIETISREIRNPRRKFLCINDVSMSEEKYLKYRKGILDAFEARFPKKSAYEL